MISSANLSTLSRMRDELKLLPESAVFNQLACRLLRHSTIQMGQRCIASIVWVIQLLNLVRDWRAFDVLFGVTEAIKYFRYKAENTDF